MRGPCKELAARLTLYAEGELSDAASTRLVKGHLKTCAPCRGYLDLHDRLTRAILAGTGARDLESERRAEKAWERIRFSPPPEWLDAGRREIGEAQQAHSPPGRGSAGASPSQETRRVPCPPGAPHSRRFRLAAAVVLFGSLLAISFAWRRQSPSHGNPSTRVAGGAAAGQPLASLGAPVAHAAGDLWWVLEDEPSQPTGETRTADPPVFPALLRGFRAPPGQRVRPDTMDSGASLEAEVILSTLVAGRSGSAEGQRFLLQRFFLVPGGWTDGASAGETLEICSVLRLGAADEGRREPPAAAVGWKSASISSPRLYRFFIGYDFRHSPYGRSLSVPILPAAAAGQNLFDPLNAGPSDQPLFSAPTTWH